MVLTHGILPDFRGGVHLFILSYSTMYRLCARHPDGGNKSSSVPQSLVGCLSPSSFAANSLHLAGVLEALGRDEIVFSDSDMSAKYRSSDEWPEEAKALGKPSFVW